MTYTQTLDRLATATEQQVVAAFASWEAGRITLTEFLAVATAFLTAAGNRATALADAALAAHRRDGPCCPGARSAPARGRPPAGARHHRRHHGHRLRRDVRHKGCGGTPRPILNSERESA